MVNVGVFDNLSVGTGFDFISMFMRTDEDWSPILNFNFKTGFKVHDYIHIGAGSIIAVMPSNFYAGMGYFLNTFGTYNNNFTAGIGWGFAGEESQSSFMEKPFIMLGCMLRCSEKVWFVSENWLAPVDPNNRYYPVVSYGLRFSGRKISVDLGFINSADIVEAIIIGIPYVDFVVKFGK